MICKPFERSSAPSSWIWWSRQRESSTAGTQGLMWFRCTSCHFCCWGTILNWMHVMWCWMLNWMQLWTGCYLWCINWCIYWMLKIFCLCLVMHVSASIYVLCGKSHRRRGREAISVSYENNQRRRMLKNESPFRTSMGDTCLKNMSPIITNIRDACLKNASPITMSIGDLCLKNASPITIN